MFSTTEALQLLRSANPSRPVSEDRIRHAIRSRRITSPAVVGGAMVWLPADVRRLAEALSLRAPSIEEASQ